MPPTPCGYAHARDFFQSLCNVLLIAEPVAHYATDPPAPEFPEKLTQLKHEMEIARQRQREVARCGDCRAYVADSGGQNWF